VDEIVSQKGGPRPPFCCSAAAARLLFAERGTGVSFVGGTLFTPKSHWGSLSASRNAQESRERLGKTTIIVPLSESLPDAKYTVEWQAVSADSHKVKGKYNFESMK
jgi:methionine-rich copper-binding protein CopC